MTRPRHRHAKALSGVGMERRWCEWVPSTVTLPAPVVIEPLPAKWMAFTREIAKALAFAASAPVIPPIRVPVLPSVVGPAREAELRIRCEHAHIHSSRRSYAGSIILFSCVQRWTQEYSIIAHSSRRSYAGAHLCLPPCRCGLRPRRCSCLRTSSREHNCHLRHAAGRLRRGKSPLIGYAALGLPPRPVGRSRAKGRHRSNTGYPIREPELQLWPDRAAHLGRSRADASEGLLERLRLPRSAANLSRRPLPSSSSPESAIARGAVGAGAGARRRKRASERGSGRGTRETESWGGEGGGPRPGRWRGGNRPSP
eukprot:SAG31_NODE_2899_length_4933_cov_2.793795_3_plen_312_part_00